VDFYRLWPKAFWRGQKRLNFSFTNSKLRKKYCQISKFGGSSPRPPGTPFKQPWKRVYYVHVRQTTFVPQYVNSLAPQGQYNATGLHHVFQASAPAATIQSCLGSGSSSTAHLSVSFGFAIIVQHYNTMLHRLCSFCVMSCCHNLSFVDVLLLRSEANFHFRGPRLF